MPELILYTRAACHLCEEAKAQLDALRREFPFELQVVDIDSDPALRAQYTNDVPVVLLDGKKVAKHRLDLAQLRRQLSRMSQGRSHAERSKASRNKSPQKADSSSRLNRDSE